MKRKNKGWLAGLSLLLMLLLLFPSTALANSAEPPGIVILVSGAPEGLTISMARTEEGMDEPILLQEKRQGWEAYYRYYYHMDPYDGPYVEKTLKSVVIHVKGGGYDFSLPLPSESFNSYNNLLTLDLETQTVTEGQPIWRIPVLVGVRVLLTLLIEGGIFWLFGYRKKVSWAIFGVTNLLTQTGLNLALTSSIPGAYSYWLFGLVVLEILVLIVELIAYCLFLWEKKKSVGAGFAVLANVASLFLGALLMMYLPI